MPDYDDDNSEFEELVDLLYEVGRQRDQREHEREQLLKDCALGRDVREQFEREAARDAAHGAYFSRERMAEEDRRFQRNITEAQTRLAHAKRVADGWAAEQPRLRSEAEARNYAARLAAHRAMLRREIPQMLSKALEIQRRGGCTSADVCRIQAETIRLAERFAL